MASSYSGGYLAPNSWYRLRVQLGGALLFAVLVPYAIAVAISARLLGLAVFQQSLVASALAVTIGYYLFRSLVAYPGIRASYYILPVYSSVFALLFIVLLMLRLQYSRPLLIVSYLVCIGWAYLVHFMIQRQPSMRFGLVPFGEVDALRAIRGVEWTMLESPTRPTERFTAIVADFRADMPDAWETLLADMALSEIPVLHTKQLGESLTGQVQIEHLSENAHGTLVPHGVYRNAKLAVDIVLSAVALIPLAPFLVVVALLVKFDSAGPVFFRQTRIGYRGVPFRVWKFRTMTHRTGDSAKTRLAAITQSNDARITRLGRVLRRTRIDELPQLMNVAIGQMSLIGPRPEAHVLSSWYEQEIPFYRYRHIVRPGITGWAQVNQGHVAEVADVHSKLHYDFYYISNFSLWIDILIVIRTIRTIVTGFGSR